MTLSIREPRDADFFPWLTLYEAFAAARGVELTEQKALLLWTWLSDQAHPEKALIAVDEEGELSGFAHFHAFPRPLEGDTGVFVDAFYLAASAAPDTGGALLDGVRSAAAASGSSVIRWTKAADEQVPEALNATAGEPTRPETYELQTTAQPA